MLPIRHLLATFAVAHVFYVVSASDPPQQVHIALAGKDVNSNSNAMAVSWVTNSKTSTSTVKFGLSASSLDQTASGSCSTYYQTWDHHAVMPNLLPATVYYYIVGDADAGWSRVFSFKTAPLSSTSDSTVHKWLLWGDMGVWNSEPARTLLNQSAPAVDVIQHVGDISYADDAFLHHPTEFKYEWTWNTFMSWMENVTAHKPYMTNPGNHEAECHSGFCFLEKSKRDALGNFTAYRNRFRMPNEESNGVENMWYSYNYGPVHWVNVDTETDYPNSPNDDYASHNGGFGDQLAWLEADLKAATAPEARALRPWIIVSGHRPVYGHDDATKAMTAAFEPLFIKYKIDVFFAGHVHAYERSWPVANLKVTAKDYNKPAAPVYIVQGAGGCTEGHSTFNPETTADWIANENGVDWGVGFLNINRTALSWEFRRGIDGTVADAMVITK